VDELLGGLSFVYSIFINISSFKSIWEKKDYCHNKKEGLLSDFYDGKGLYSLKPGWVLLLFGN